MRKLILAAAALVVVGAVLAASDRVRAMPASPGGLRPAIDSISHVEQVARCWRRGWHGRGWYACRRAYAPRAHSWHRPYRSYRYSYRGRHHHWR
jgi:hypothetical protein